MTRTTSPRGRQIALTVGYVVCLVGSFIGVGALGGTPIAEAAGGVLAADATHLAPASGAFSVWSLIYVVLGAYTLWQWWDRTDERRVAWLVADCWPRPSGAATASTPPGSTDRPRIWHHCR